MDQKLKNTHGQSLKKTLGHFEITFLKYNGQSIFLTFLNIGRNSSTKNFRIKIWTFSFQICFRNQFLTSEVVKLKIRKYAYLCIFRLTTSRSPKLIPKADLKCECPYFYSKKNSGEFRSISKKKKSKNGFSIGFSKSD